LKAGEPAFRWTRFFRLVSSHRSKHLAVLSSLTLASTSSLNGSSLVIQKKPHIKEKELKKWWLRHKLLKNITKQRTSTGFLLISCKPYDYRQATNELHTASPIYSIGQWTEGRRQAISQPPRLETTARHKIINDEKKAVCIIL